MRAGGVAALALAVVVFVGGTLLGFSLLTSSADVTEPVATCTPRVVKSGEKVTTNLVTVDVFNASRTAGLANRVSIQLQRRGFLAGNIANNPSSSLATDDVIIIASDRSDPRVRLVAAQFTGDISYVAPPSEGSGRVVVIVGSNWADKDLRGKAPIEATTDRDVTVCVPVVPAV